MPKIHTYSIAQAAKMLNVSADTLRRWEREGKISSVRTPGGHRRYGSEELERVISSKKLNKLANKPVEIVETQIPYKQIAWNAVKLTAFIMLFPSLLFALAKIPYARIAEIAIPAQVQVSINRQLATIGINLPHKPKALSLISNNILAESDLLQDVNFQVNVPTNLTNTASFDGEVIINNEVGQITFPSTAAGEVLINAPGQTIGVDIGGTGVTTFTANGVVYGNGVGGLLTTAAPTSAQLIIADADGVPAFVTLSGDATVSNTGVLGISSGAIIETDLNATDDPADNEILSYDSGSGGFTWVADDSGTNFFTDGGTFVYLTTITDDLVLGGITVATADIFLGDTGGAIFNDQGNAVDFRIEGDTEANLFVADASTNRIGIGTLTPSALFDLQGDGRVGSGFNFSPDVDLGADLGTASLKWNNIYADNLIIDSGSTFAGQLIVTYNPADTTFGESSIRVNVTTPAANEQMLGIGQAGEERAAIDAEGDLTIGYDGIAGSSVPESANPLSVYGHNTTEIAFIDTSGNLTVTGKLALGAATINTAHQVTTSFYETGFTDFTQYRGISNVWGWEPAGDPQASIGYGLFNYVYTAGAEDILTTTGAWNQFVHAGSGTLTNAFGSYSYSDRSSGTITNSYGGYGYGTGGTNNFGTYGYGFKYTAAASGESKGATGTYGGLFYGDNNGVVTTGTDDTFGVYIGVENSGSTGGINNTYGAYIDIGTVTNAGAGTANLYGLYIDDVTGADTNYTIYSPSTADSYLAGALGIGEIAPEAPLEITTTGDGKFLQLTTSDDDSFWFGQQTNGCCGDLTFNGPAGEIWQINESEDVVVFNGLSIGADSSYHSSSGTGVLRSEGGGTYPFSQTGSLVLYSRVNSQTDIVFSTFDGTSHSNRVTIDALGNVGIGSGNSTPVGLLDVDSTNQDTFGKALVILNHDENQDLFTASASGNTRFTIENDGNVVTNSINGVRVVDGVTYAQTCAGINAAIDSLPSTGGEIFLPEGTYSCAETITVDVANTTIRGAGHSTIIDASSLVDITLNTGVWNNVIFADFRINANNAAAGDSNTVAVGSADGGEVRNLYITNSDYRAIVVQNCADCIINGNIISAPNEAGIYTAGAANEGTVISNNFITGSLNAGIYASGGPAAIKFTDNHIVNATNYGIYNNTGSEGIFSGNTVINPGINGLHVVAGTGNNIFTNNYFEDDGTATGNAIRIRNSGADNNLIANNTITGFTLGIVFQTGATNNIAVNNIIIGATTKYNDQVGTNQILDNLDGKLAIGTTATSDTGKLHIATNTTASTGKSVLILDQNESEDIFTASASGTTVAIVNVGGDLLLDGVFNVGDTTPEDNAYNTVGTGTASNVASGEIEDGSDVYITDDVEIDGDLFLDGATVLAAGQDTTLKGKIDLTGITGINDVFVYDTTKDSDGGAWRHDERAKSSSWYNEAIDATGAACTLDTDDRCGNRAFPEKAIIVATDTDLFIFDAKDNTQWMNFDEGTNFFLFDTTVSLSSVYAFNGKIYLGSDDSSNGAALVVNFLNEKMERYRVGSPNGHIVYSGSISQRNSAMTASTMTDSMSIVNNVVNDIHAVVINGKTYVVVATDGGVSVINEADQVVIDYENYANSANFPSKKTWITAQGSLYVQAEDILSVYHNYLMVKHNVQDDSSDQAYAWHDMLYGSGSTPALSYDTSTQQTPTLWVTEGTSTIDGRSNTIYTGSNTGLTAINEKQGDESNGSAKYYTSSYITEEMVGDIRNMNPMNGSGETVANTTLSNFDASVKANDFTTAGAGTTPNYVTGVRGTALEFDGGDYVCTGTTGTCADDTDLDMTSTFSVGAWVYHDNNIGEIIAAKRVDSTTANGNFVLYHDGVSGFTFTVLGSSATSSVQVASSPDNDAAWHHVVGVFDDTNNMQYLYVDGAQMDSDANSETPNDVTASLKIGAQYDTPSAFWTGEIDEVMVTAEALTPGQIKHMYEVGKRALEQHSASEDRDDDGVTDNDTLQQLANGENDVHAVAVDDGSQVIFVGSGDGSDGAVSIIGVDNDSRVDTYTEDNGKLEDDGTTTYDVSNITSISVSGYWDSQYHLGSKNAGDSPFTLAIAGTDDGTNGTLWAESADYSLYSTLATLTSPNLVKDNITVNNIFRVYNTYNNLADSTTGETIQTPAFEIDQSGNFVSQSLVDSTTAMQFKNAAGTTLLNLDTTNNRVGIGTVSPEAILDIGIPDSEGTLALSITDSAAGGAIFFRDNTNNAGVFEPNLRANIGNSTGRTFILEGNAYSGTDTGTVPITTFRSSLNKGTVSTRPLFQWQNGTNTALMQMDVDGNVGIGDTTPESKLKVATNTTTLTGKSVLILDQLESEDIFTASASGDTKFVIDNNGNVGIGDTTPDALLNILGTTEQLRLDFDDSNYASFTVAADGELVLQTTGTDEDIEIRTGTFDNAIFIDDSASRIGIGRNNPSIFLDVDGGADDGIARFLSSDAGTRISLEDDTDVAYLIMLGGTAGIGFDSSISSNNLNVTSTGNVGIGDSSPESKLKVATNTTTLTGKSVLILDQLESEDIFTASASGTTEFAVASDGKLYIGDNTTLGTSTALCWETQTLNGDTVYQVGDCLSTPADYSEMYPVAQGIEYGDIVAIGSEDVITADGSTIKQLVKADREYQTSTVGITSDNYHDFTLAGSESIRPEDNPLPVALNGRVPVKVSPSSDPINPGDFVTSSSDPGKAIKATRAGFTIGKALESWDPTSPEATRGKDTVMIFVQNTWYEPPLLALSPEGDITQGDQLSVSNNQELINEPSLADSADDTRLTELEDKVASMSAELEQVTALALAMTDVSLSEDFSIASDSARLTDLAVLGSTTLGDTVITGSLSVGLLSIDPIDQSIDAVGTLKIQSLELGALDIMNGKVEIDQKGNIHIKEGQIAGNSSFRDSIIIEPGTDSIIIEREWDTPPVTITTTPSWNTNVWVTDKSENGFTVNFSSAPSEESNIDWIAVW